MLRQFLNVSMKAFIMLALAFRQQSPLNVAFALFGLALEIFRQLVHAGGVKMLGSGTNVIYLLSSFLVAFTMLASLVMLCQLVCLFQQAMGMFMPFAPGRQPREGDKPASEELKALKEQLSEMQKKIDRLG